MTEENLERVAKLMRDIDICEFVTLKGNRVAGRPMSNNGEVDYDGDSYFFTRKSSGMVADIQTNSNVALVFHKSPGLLSGAPVFVHLQGHADLVHDRAVYEEHWHKSLDMWFEQGVDTPDLIMIKVHGIRAAYWDGSDNGDIILSDS